MQESILEIKKLYDHLDQPNSALEFIYIDHEKNLTTVNNLRQADPSAAEESKFDSMYKLIGKIFANHAKMDNVTINAMFGPIANPVFNKILSQSYFNYKAKNGFGCQIYLSALAHVWSENSGQKEPNVSCPTIQRLLQKYAMAGIIEVDAETWASNTNLKQTQYIQVNPILLRFLQKKELKSFETSIEILRLIFDYRCVQNQNNNMLQGFKFSVKYGQRVTEKNKIANLEVINRVVCEAEKKIKKTETKQIDKFLRKKEEECFIALSGSLFRDNLKPKDSSIYVLEWEEKENCTREATRQRQDLAKTLRKYGGFATGLGLLLFCKKGENPDKHTYGAKTWLNTTKEEKTLSLFIKEFPRMVNSPRFLDDIIDKDREAARKWKLFNYYSRFFNIPPDFGPCVVSENLEKRRAELLKESRQTGRNDEVTTPAHQETKN